MAPDGLLSRQWNHGPAHATSAPSQDGPTAHAAVVSSRENKGYISEPFYLFLLIIVGLDETPLKK